MVEFQHALSGTGHKLRAGCQILQQGEEAAQVDEVPA